jgi:hypothetical protein
MMSVYRLKKLRRICELAYLDILDDTMPGEPVVDNDWMSFRPTLMEFLFSDVRSTLDESSELVLSRRAHREGTR